MMKPLQPPVGQGHLQSLSSPSLAAAAQDSPHGQRTLPPLKNSEATASAGGNHTKQSDGGAGVGIAGYDNAEGQNEIQLSAEALQSLRERRQPTEYAQAHQVADTSGSGPSYYREVEEQDRSSSAQWMQHEYGARQEPLEQGNQHFNEEESQRRPASSASKVSFADQGYGDDRRSFDAHDSVYLDGNGRLREYNADSMRQGAGSGGRGMYQSGQQRQLAFGSRPTNEQGQAYSANAGSSNRAAIAYQHGPNRRHFAGSAEQLKGNASADGMGGSNQDTWGQQEQAIFTERMAWVAKAYQHHSARASGLGTLDRGLSIPAIIVAASVTAGLFVTAANMNDSNARTAIYVFASINVISVVLMAVHRSLALAQRSMVHEIIGRLMQQTLRDVEDSLVKGAAFMPTYTSLTRRIADLQQISPAVSMGDMLLPIDVKYGKSKVKNRKNSRKVKPVDELYENVDEDYEADFAGAE